MYLYQQILADHLAVYPPIQKYRPHNAAAIASFLVVVLAATFTECTYIAQTTSVIIVKYVTGQTLLNEIRQKR
jgi:hypothetical protein